MQLDDLTKRFSDTRENQGKAIFSTLFIAGNKLQTLFDSHIPELSLKQFMLLSVVRQSKDPLTFTQLGNLLGCSRQNIRKLADVLAKKGFITISQSPCDPRAMCICPTQKAEDYFQKDFSPYQEELKALFEVYSDRELETLFRLLSRLYKGIEHLAKQSLEVDAVSGATVSSKCVLKAVENAMGNTMESTTENVAEKAADGGLKK